MKLKLDENLGVRGAVLLRLAGHDVATVFDQDLCTASDETLIEVCRAERRCLVTLDLDFANPLRFDPSRYPGIAVLRLPSRPSLSAIDDTVRTLASALERDSIDRRLWIIEVGRVRQYENRPGE